MKRRWRLSLLLAVLVVFTAGGMRLAAGPVEVDGLRFLLIDRLQREIPGARATIGRMQLVWFHDSNAIGLRLSDVAIKDARAREIARAKNLEAALAIDSLLVWHLAPARLNADQFFLAASVSEGGRYELGYDARGKPEALGGLDKVFLDLVGPEKLGSPASFVRSVSLQSGVVTLRQANSKLNWRAEIDRFGFIKRRGRIRANVGLKIQSAAGVSKLYTVSDAEVGLKSATLAARIENLTPSEVFPSVGVTKMLSNFHAPVNGRGNLSYTAKSGLEGAFVDISAGRGQYDFGKSQQDFDAMKIIASYSPKNRTVSFDRFELVSHLIETDLRGKVRIVPEDKRHKQLMRVDFDFSGPRVTGKLADDFKAQTMRDVHFVGAFTPDARKLTITKGQGLMDKSAVETQGELYTDAKGQLGANLTASIKGDFSKEQVFVFWPENLSGITRDNLIERIKGGTYSNARFTLKAPPGHLNDENLKNEDLRLDFEFRDMGLSFDTRMKDATGLSGHGTLLGDSFSLDLAGGHLLNVDLRSGGINVPSFHKATGLDHVHIWLESQGQGADIIEAIDPVTGNELGKHGFNHERLSGNAEVRLDVRFPTFERLHEKNLDIRFEAKMKDAGLKRAALGWDLIHGTLSVKGDLLANRLSIDGIADLGPYRGQIAYDSAFVPKQMKIGFVGDFDAQPFGGSPTVRVPIRGDFLIEGPNGRGQITSDVYNGRVVWTGKDDPNEVGETRGEPTQVDLDGHILTPGLVKQGIPIFARLKPEIPTQVTLLRAGNIWSGVMSAEVLTGDIAYIQGAGSRLVYKASITPAKARAFGFGGLTMFRQTRQLTLNIGLETDTKEALITLDRLQGVMGWSQAPTEREPLRTFDMTLKPEHLTLIGLPASVFKPKNPVDVSAYWKQDAQATRGQVTLKYTGGKTPISFVMPNDPRNGTQREAAYVARVSGNIDPPLLTALGYTQDPIKIKGKVAAVFTLSEKGEDYASVVNFDLREAELAYAGSNWAKPAGEAGQFALSFEAAGDQQGLNITRIYAAGASLAMEGRAALDTNGQVEFADFSKLYAKNFMSGTLRFYQNEALKSRLISVNGTLLDLRPFINRPKVSGPPQKTAQVTGENALAFKTRIVVDLARVQMTPEAFTDVRLDVTADPLAGMSGEGQFKSQNGTEGRLRVEPLPDSPKVMSHFVLTSDDMGNLMRTAFDVRQIHGGKGEISGYFTAEQADFVFKARDIRARQIPVMAQLLSIASLRGAADTMTGEGISFSEVNMPVRYKDGLVYIDGGWAKGDALGFNVRGTSAADGKLNLSGILIPAYSFNAIFGDVHDRGEGLVGIKYAIAGTYKVPQVTVDPLSTIMPGFLRRWLEKTPPAAIAPLDVPNDHGRKSVRLGEATPQSSPQSSSGAAGSQ